MGFTHYLSWSKVWTVDIPLGFYKVAECNKRVILCHSPELHCTWSIFFCSSVAINKIKTTYLIHLQCCVFHEIRYAFIYGTIHPNGSRSIFGNSRYYDYDDSIYTIYSHHRKFIFFIYFFFATACFLYTHWPCFVGAPKSYGIAISEKKDEKALTTARCNIDNSTV